MDCKYTNEEFLKLIDKDNFAEWETNPISVQTLCELGIEGLNEVACDDIVEDGYLLEDIGYDAKEVKDGEVIIGARGHAGSWKEAHCCPICGALKKVVMVPDEVGKGLHESAECSVSCGWSEEAD